MRITNRRSSGTKGVPVSFAGATRGAAGLLVCLAVFPVLFPSCGHVTTLGAHSTAISSTTCEEVRAVFVGSPLSRGLAMLKLSRAQFDKLFPDRSRRKNPYNLMRYARRIQGPEAQRALANASVRQLQAAAQHEGEDAQINAAIRWTLGFERT